MEKKMDTRTLPLGYIVATPAALEALSNTSTNALRLLRRHSRGDWGELCAEDIEANRLAVAIGARILSAYTLPNGEKLWVITEASREVTTILKPEDY
jgi:hypothetical protein